MGHGLPAIISPSSKALTQRPHGPNSVRAHPSIIRVASPEETSGLTGEEPAAHGQGNHPGAVASFGRRTLNDRLSRQRLGPIAAAAEPKK
jgi:hypothetical protein